MKAISWLCLLLLLGACSEPKKNYVLQVKLRHLSAKDIYDKDLVYDVIFDAEEQDVDSLKLRSRQLFLQGVDQLKNKKRPAKAKLLFISSILTFPEAKTYYELGNALLELKFDPGDAYNAFEVARHLDFKPAGNTFYGQAVASTQLAEEKDYTLGLLGSALESGFTDTLKLYREPRLRHVINSKEFKNYLRDQKLHALAEGKPDQLFDIFRNSFAKVPQPFEIPAEKVDMKAYDQSVNYDFARFIPEMQNSSFGRDVSHDYFYVARVAETPQYTALLYSSVQFYGEDMQPVLTKLVTYNNQGKQISSLLFSCQCSAEKIKQGRIEDNRITLEDYRRIWKHPIDKVAFEKNSVAKLESLAKATFKIAEDGKIEEESVPEGYKEGEATIASN